jgi:hypothetical protein
MIYADRLSISPVMSLIKSEFNLSFASDAVVMTASEGAIPDRIFFQDPSANNFDLRNSVGSSEARFEQREDK